MKAVEFEAIAYNNILHLPPGVPDGKKMRILLLFDDNIADETEIADIKSQLINLTEGLSDNDLNRQNDTGREVPDWHF